MENKQEQIDQEIEKIFDTKPIEPLNTLFVFAPNNKYYEKFQEYLNYIDLICSNEISENQTITNEVNQPLILLKTKVFYNLQSFRTKKYIVEHFKTDKQKIDQVIFIQYDFDRIFQKPDILEILKVSHFHIASPIDTPEMTTMIIKKSLEKAYKREQRLKSLKS